MKRCSRPSPLSPLSPLGTKDTVSSEETKKENVRTLKQASSEKSVFSELRKKEGKKIRCTTPKRIDAFGADNNVEYGSNGSDGSDDVDDVDDVDGAPTSKVADTERASEAASDHDEDPNKIRISDDIYFCFDKYDIPISMPETTFLNMLTKLQEAFKATDYLDMLKEIEHFFNKYKTISPVTKFK